jgi:hypothetical protein
LLRRPVVWPLSSREEPKAYEFRETNQLFAWWIIVIPTQALVDNFLVRIPRIVILST